jgi:hypothetical protein
MSVLNAESFLANISAQIVGFSTTTKIRNHTTAQGVEFVGLVARKDPFIVKNVTRAYQRKLKVSTSASNNVHEEIVQYALKIYTRA